MHSLRKTAFAALACSAFALFGCATTATSEEEEDAAQTEDALTTTISMTCTSSGNRFQECRPGTPRGRIVNVRLTRQRSTAPCTQGTTWGFDADRIWVDRGCRGSFAVEIEPNTPPPPPPSSGPVKLFGFPSCDDFWLVATVTGWTNCDAVTQRVSAVLKDGRCDLIGPSDGREVCFANRPPRPEIKFYRFPSCDDFWMAAELTPETNCDAITETISAVKRDGQCHLIGPSNGRETCLLHRPQ